MSDEQKSLFEDFADHNPIENSPAPLVETPGDNFTALDAQKFDYEIRRSKRRKKSVGAYRERGKTVIIAPVRMSNKEVQQYAAELIAQLNAHDEKNASQKLLETRARHLTKIYLDIDVFEFVEPSVSIRWVTNQNSRWGSCSPDDREIRISHRIQGMPQYVIDAVILHELVHLIVADHSPKFYAYLEKYDQYAMAREYLAGYSFAQQNLNL